MTETSTSAPDSFIVQRMGAEEGPFAVAQLREQAKALGLPVPPPRRPPDYTAVWAQASREMLTLFERADGR